MQNNSNLDLANLKPFVKRFLPYAQKKMGFNHPPVINFMSDAENSQNILGKTAFYDPSTYKIVVYVDGRHPKDILRSLSHELVHHTQNCRGDFEDREEVGETSVGYAQKNPHLREMEREAYELGNMCFRDWEDTYKQQLQETTYYNKNIIIGNKHVPKGENIMTEEKLRATVREALLTLAILDENLDELDTSESTEDEELDERKRRASERNKSGRREDAKLKALEEVEESAEEEVIDEEAEESDEDTLEEWKNKTLYESLVKKWTK